MKAITIDKLATLCKQQQKLGNGKKMILLSSDDEGNEYHEMFFGFTDGDEAAKYIDDYQLPRGVDLKDYVILA